MALAKRRVFGWGNLVISSVLMLVGWVVIVLLTARPEFKFLFDMTPDKSATVTETTEALIDELHEREGEHIEIFTFFEQWQVSGAGEAHLAVFNQIVKLTEDLLRQYAALGGDKIRVQHVNHRQEPDRAREIVDRLGGVSGQHVVVVAVVRELAGGGESIRTKELIVNQDLAQIDLGSDIAVPGASQRIPRLQDYTGEEQLSSAIKTLLAGGTPTLYVLTGHNEGGNSAKDLQDGPYGYSELMGGLQDEGFKVFDGLNLGDNEIPDDATAIACLDPTGRAFSREESDKLIAWLKRGGRLFLNLVQHVPPSQNVDLSVFLDQLGVKVGPELVAQLYDNMNSELARQLTIKRLNPQHRITKLLAQQQRSLALVDARPIESIQPPLEGIAVDPTLLISDDFCWLVKDKDAPLVPPSASAFRSFSPGVTIDVVPEAGSSPGKVVLVTGLGFTNQFIRQGAQRDFVLNCFNWLVERMELVTVRRDPIRATAIDFGADQDERVDRLSRAWMLLVVLTPLFFLGLGVFVAWRRRRI